MVRRILTWLLTAGMLLTCAHAQPPWHTTPEEDAEFEATLKRCMGQPCERETLLKYGIVVKDRGIAEVRLFDTGNVALTARDR